MKNYDFEYTKLVMKKKGTAQLSENHIFLELDGMPKVVQFADLMSYKVEYYNGVTLVLRFSDRSKLKIVANSNFCNEVPFENLCKDLEDSLSRYIAENNSALIRKPGIFEQRWMILFPILFTLATLYLLIRSLSVGKAFTASIYINIALTISFWIAYLNAQKHKKEREML